MLIYLLQISFCLVFFLFKRFIFLTTALALFKNHFVSCKVKSAGFELLKVRKPDDYNLKNIKAHLLSVVIKLNHEF